MCWVSTGIVCGKGSKVRGRDPVGGTPGAGVECRIRLLVSAKSFAPSAGRHMDAAHAAFWQKPHWFTPANDEERRELEG
jgi:hypothetical protein